MERRLKVRRVSEHSVLQIAEDAAAVHGIAVAVRHGGGVANAYGYPAETECVGAAAYRDADGHIRSRVTPVGRIPANKVTLRGACYRGTNLPLGVERLFDFRCFGVVGPLVAGHGIPEDLASALRAWIDERPTLSRRAMPDAQLAAAALAWLGAR